MKKDSKNLTYFNMIIGFIGMSFIIVALAKYLIIQGGLTGIMLPWIGLLCILHYIYHLEEKAGIPKKLVWIRGGILAIVLIAASIAVFP